MNDDKNEPENLENIIPELELEEVKITTKNEPPLILPDSLDMRWPTIYKGGLN